MSDNLIQITAWNEKAEAKAYQAENKAYHEREFLQCIAKINRALQKTGEDPQTLAHLFLHMSMVLCDGGFHKMLAQGQKGGDLECSSRKKKRK